MYYMDIWSVEKINQMSDHEVWDNLSVLQQTQMLNQYGKQQFFIKKYREGMSKGNGNVYFSPRSFVEMIFDIA